MMNRRDFIKGLGIMGAGLALSGCSFSDIAPIEDPNATPKVEGEKVSEGAVEMREIPHTGIKVSTIALGSGCLHNSSDSEIERITAHAIDCGINIVDTCMYNIAPARAMARGMRGRRDKVITQMHIGIDYPGDTYLRTRNLKDVQDGFEYQMQTYETDYSDIGMIHYVDTFEDYDDCINNGLLDYAQKLKQDGTIRMIGLSSHSVAVTRKFMETGLLDVIMFSLNPAYDFTVDNGVIKIDPDRKSLYEEIQRMGIATTVMKTYAGGKLLYDFSSPFGQAMTPTQCIQYCLDRPSIVTNVLGISNMDELNSALKYYSATPEEKDYSFIWGSQPANMEGVCIYCNHCFPCPVGIDIGSVGKYYDLAKNGDEVAKEHYMSLAKAASDCNDCGECEPRCPFHVKIMDHMHEISAYFGR